MLFRWFVKHLIYLKTLCNTYVLEFLLFKNYTLFSFFRFRFKHLVGKLANVEKGDTLVKKQMGVLADEGYGYGDTPYNKYPLWPESLTIHMSPKVNELHFLRETPNVRVDPLSSYHAEEFSIYSILLRITGYFLFILLFVVCFFFISLMDIFWIQGISNLDTWYKQLLNWFWLIVNMTPDGVFPMFCMSSLFQLKLYPMVLITDYFNKMEGVFNSEVLKVNVHDPLLDSGGFLCFLEKCTSIVGGGPLHFGVEDVKSSYNSLTSLAGPLNGDYDSEELPASNRYFPDIAADVEHIYALSGRADDFSDISLFAKRGLLDLCGFEMDVESFLRCFRHESSKLDGVHYYPYVAFNKVLGRYATPLQHMARVAFMQTPLFKVNLIKYMEPELFNYLNITFVSWWGLKFWFELLPIARCGFFIRDYLALDLIYLYFFIFIYFFLLYHILYGSGHVFLLKNIIYNKESSYKYIYVFYNSLLMILIVFGSIFVAFYYLADQLGDILTYDKFFNYVWLDYYGYYTDIFTNNLNCNISVFDKYDILPYNKEAIYAMHTVYLKKEYSLQTRQLIDLLAYSSYIKGFSVLMKKDVQFIDYDFHLYLLDYKKHALEGFWEKSKGFWDLREYESYASKVNRLNSKPEYKMSLYTYSPLLYTELDDRQLSFLNNDVILDSQELAALLRKIQKIETNRYFFREYPYPYKSIFCYSPRAEKSLLHKCAIIDLLFVMPTVIASVLTFGFGLDAVALYALYYNYFHGKPSGGDLAELQSVLKEIKKECKEYIDPLLASESSSSGSSDLAAAGTEVGEKVVSSTCSSLQESDRLFKDIWPITGEQRGSLEITGSFCVTDLAKSAYKQFLESLRWRDRAVLWDLFKWLNSLESNEEKLKFFVSLPKHVRQGLALYGGFVEGRPEQLASILLKNKISVDLLNSVDARVFYNFVLDKLGHTSFDLVYEKILSQLDFSQMFSLCLNIDHLGVLVSRQACIEFIESLDLKDRVYMSLVAQCVLTEDTTKV